MRASSQGGSTVQPIAVTVTSSGSSPWKLTNWQIAPFAISFAGRASALSSNWQIDVTLDDPSNVYPSTAGTPLVLASSAVGGPAIASSNAVGVITQPIAAWRVTNTSTGGIVTVTALQAGVG